MGDINNWPLDMHVMNLKDQEGRDNFFSLNRCAEGFSVTGGVGSGKTSGSLQFLALNFLKRDFGGIVLTAKTDEVDNWIEYCTATDRLKDLVIFGEHGTDKLCFDPMMFMAKLPGGKNAQNLSALLISLSKMGGRITGAGDGQSQDPFWDAACRRLIGNAVNLLQLAQIDVSIENIDNIIRAAQPEVDIEVKKFLNVCLSQAFINKSNPSDERIFKNVKNYFQVDFKTIPEKTRGSILEIWRSIADPFLNDLLAEYFMGSISEDVSPDMTFEGKIIVVNFSVKEYFEVGAIAQQVYKIMFQRAVERRKVDDSARPVFQFIDESHYFLTEQDYLFLTTARSKKCISVYATQQISNYYASLPGTKVKDKVNAFLGSLITKIIHSTTDYVSNDLYAKLIGKSYQRLQDFNASTNKPEQFWRYAYDVEPTEFGKLKTGTEDNGFKVEGMVVSRGKWANGRSFMTLQFDQHSAKKMIIALEKK
ncbi:MAG: hypothetical protein IPP04_06980 [Saprospiraceae bacterium]|nr:hypothetical protein [Saprospiraceae bacterium]